ncbi:MAG: hypothetical protein U5S82_09800 [Gammaproteobacteria bacterium]|nr:hypothetical protein [Gammaproteobacteria bacterium]
MRGHGYIGGYIISAFIASHECIVVINRAAIILRYKQPAIAWLNAVEAPPDGSELTAADTDHESTLYLIAPEDAETWDTVEEWVAINYQTLFEAELEAWYADPALWPHDRGYPVFRDWFDIECHTVLVDTVGTPILDEDDEEAPPYLDA